MNDTIATGHMMRCLAIADAAKSIGQSTVFILADNEAVGLLKERGYEYIVLDTDWNNMESEIGILEQLILKWKINRILIDSYQVTKSYLQKLQKLTEVYYIDDLIIDTLKHKVFKDNKELELSTITFALLMALVEGHGRVLTRDYLLMLIEDITGHVVEDNTLTTHLKRLRQTLGE